MELFEAIILGLVQGLTEFLPVSSSGHIELGSFLLGTDPADNLLFSILVHGATALSTVVVFRKDILSLLSDLFQFKWNDGTRFIFLIIISMIPVGVVGLLWEKEIEKLFGGDIIFVALMLLVTGTLLLITHFTKNREGVVTAPKALVIGIAQAIAILPGISRSGSTIATALYLGVEKSRATRFSFLMVLPPILGATLLKVKDLFEADGSVATSIETSTLIAGFLAAFVSGLLACQLMIRIVRRGKLIYFAYYCYLVALITIGVYYLG
jgi:undecaprenyl-diphosphatase